MRRPACSPRGSPLPLTASNAATALHRATRTQCAAAVEYLLHVGSDPTTRNKTGATAFHLAVQHTGRGGTGTDEAKMAQQQIIAAGATAHLVEEVASANQRRSSNVEVKFTGPDGVTVDLSEAGWMGTED